MFNLEAAPVPAPIELSDGAVIMAPKRPVRVITEDEITGLLTNDDRFISVALLILYSRQTADEKNQSTTRYLNGKGFSAFDARRGTYYAEWASGRNVRFPDRAASFMLGNRRVFFMTGRHLAQARKLLHKYRKQLAEVCNDVQGNPQVLLAALR